MEEVAEISVFRTEAGKWLAEVAVANHFGPTEHFETLDALLHVVARMIADKGGENGNEG